MIHSDTDRPDLADGASASRGRNRPGEAEAAIWTSTPVYVVDDDLDVLSSTSLILQAFGGSPTAYCSGPDFFAAVPGLAPGCILLDIRMSPMDGLQVLRELRKRGLRWPVIIMTGHGDIPLAVETMKLGAVDFMEKPFSPPELLDRLTHAHRLIELNSEELEFECHARERIDALTEKELAVLRALIAGSSSKEIAQRFGKSLRTVESQRASMMARLKVESLGAAFRLAVAAGVEPLP